MEHEMCLGKSGQDLAMSPYFICVFSLLKVLRTARKFESVISEYWYCLALKPSEVTDCFGKNLAEDFFT
jgi:hypothetical protein